MGPTIGSALISRAKPRGSTLPTSWRWQTTYKVLMVMIFFCNFIKHTFYNHAVLNHVGCLLVSLISFEVMLSYCSVVGWSEIDNEFAIFIYFASSFPSFLRVQSVVRLHPFHGFINFSLFCYFFCGLEHALTSVIFDWLKVKKVFNISQNFWREMKELQKVSFLSSKVKHFKGVL